MDGEIRPSSRLSEALQAYLSPLPDDRVISEVLVTLKPNPASAEEPTGVIGKIIKKVKNKIMDMMFGQAREEMTALHEWMIARRGAPNHSPRMEYDERYKSPYVVDLLDASKADIEDLGNQQHFVSSITRYYERPQPDAIVKQVGREAVSGRSPRGGFPELNFGGR